MNSWIDTLKAKVCVLPVLTSLVLSLLATPIHAASDSDLQRAYKREFAFLEAEKHTLKQRIADSRILRQQKSTTIEEELEQLQAHVMTASLRADQHQDALVQLERLAAESTEGADIVDSLLMQVDALLDKSDTSVKVPTTAEPADASRRITAGFQHALKLLEQASTVQRVPGKYFAEDGHQVQADILQIGRIASFGLAPEALGALAPAGNGRLKVWPQPEGKKVASQWLAGQAPESLSFFLYNSLEKPVERRAELTALQVIQSGGLIGWVIVFGGVVALALALLRTILLLPNTGRSARLLEQLRPLVQNKNYAQALTLVNARSGAIRRVIACTLGGISQPPHELENIIDEAVMHEQPRLDRFGNAIFVIASVAPLLGLLGTVTGMIATFDIITEFGTGNPKLLSGGISIALVTTELGLIVAIPALILGNTLNGWAERIKADLDQAALRVVNLSNGAVITARPSTSNPSAPPIDASSLATT